MEADPNITRQPELGKQSMWQLADLSTAANQKEEQIFKAPTTQPFEIDSSPASDQKNQFSPSI